MYDTTKFGDDGFGNLVKLTFQQRLQVVNACFPAFEDYI